MLSAWAPTSKSPVIVALPVPVKALITGLVKVLLVKVCVAVKSVIALVFDKSVEAIVMFAEPSKLWPAIVLAVASVVAVSALPVTSPVTSPVRVAVNTPVTVAPADVVSNFLLLSYLISTAPSAVPTRYDSSPA